MEKEPSDKLMGIQRHDIFFISVGVITPAEGYFAVFNFEDTMIADGYSVGISAEVLKDSFDAVKRRFAIDYPLLMIELSCKSLEDLWLPEMTNDAGGYELCGLVLLPEIIGR
jgi:hypothetical protein